MVSKQLKKLRTDKGEPLKVVVERMRKWGKPIGTGNLSRYENDDLKANDSTVLWILTKGHDIKEKKAQEMLAEWRKEEVEEKYHLHLAQASKKYNAPIKKKEDSALEEYLISKGLSKKNLKKAIEEIGKIVQKYKN